MKKCAKKKKKKTFTETKSLIVFRGVVRRRQMAGVLSGRAVPVQGPVLPRGAGRPVAVRRQGVQRRFSVPVVVVRRVDGGAGRRPAAHSQQPAGVPAVHAHGPVLAGTPGKGVRQVSEPAPFTRVRNADSGNPRVGDPRAIFGVSFAGRRIKPPPPTIFFFFLNRFRIGRVHGFFYERSFSVL